MKRYIILSVVFLAILSAIYVYLSRRPEYLASSYERIPQFFSLPEEDFNYSNPTVCLFELHSQGRNFENFGSAYYELLISECHLTIREVLAADKNTIDTDSSYLMTKRRGDILGTFEYCITRVRLAYITNRYMMKMMNSSMKM